jgi:hypothetical protein
MITFVDAISFLVLTFIFIMVMLYTFIFIKKLFYKVGEIKMFETTNGRICSECRKPMLKRMVSINELYVCRNEKCKHYGITVEVPILK